MQIRFLLGLLVAISFAFPVHAAQVYLDAESKEYSRLDTFYLPVRIDTKGECINAVDIALAYNPNELSIREVATGDSLITLWTERPTILRDGDKEMGRVTFQGGIPAGYCGRVEGDPGLTNTLAKLVVKAVASPVNAEGALLTHIVIEPGSLVYLNDGLGTVADTTFVGADLTLIEATGTPNDVWRQDLTNDAIAPEYFEVHLVEGPSEGSKYNYIVFSTTDKQSGIDHYEVLETDPQQFGFLSWTQRPSYWVPAESPYVLRDQQLHSTILVKAIDKKGNERIAEYTPPMSPLVAFTRMSVLIPLVILIALITVGIALTLRLARSRRRIAEDAIRRESIHDVHEV